MPNTSETAQGGGGGARVRLNTPELNVEDVELYIASIRMWTKVCGLSKTEQGLLLWIALPDKHP